MAMHLGVHQHRDPPRIYTPPSTLEQALNQVDAWSESPALVLLSEAPATWGMFRDSVAETRVIGARLHDARVAAICLLHGVRELLTADRDFSRFTGLATRNPLLPSGHE